jgi:hypothetical protein
MNTSTIIGIVVVFAIYFAVSHFFLNKKLGIKVKRRGIFSMNRNRYFLAIDFMIILLFIAAMMGFASKDFSYMLMFGLFSMISINSGIEEWLLHRKDKAYYQDWLSIPLYLAVFFILYLSEK